MIRRHEFNTRWWGAPVGLVEDERLLELPAAERERALAPFSWVELRGAPTRERVRAAAEAGFVQAGLELPFRIGLGSLPASSSLAALEARTAAEETFAIDADQLAAFRHERFAILPGATPRRIDERYALWSRDLVARDPAACLAIHAAGEVQGWFLGRRAGRSVELTLAMLRRGARISGHLLYHRALLAYAEAGATVGHAAFSATNTAVLNVYASLGARFLPPWAAWIHSARAGAERAPDEPGGEV